MCVFLLSSFFFHSFFFLSFTNECVKTCFIAFGHNASSLRCKRFIERNWHEIHEMKRNFCDEMEGKTHSFLYISPTDIFLSIIQFYSFLCSMWFIWSITSKLNAYCYVFAFAWEESMLHLNFPSIRSMCSGKSQSEIAAIHFDSIMIKCCQNTVNTLFRCSPSMYLIYNTRWSHTALSTVFVGVCSVLLGIVTFALCFTHKIYLLNNLQTKKKSRRIDAQFFESETLY